MQRNREAPDSLDRPFDSFDGSSFSGSMFGGQDPFDHPFFTSPFGGSFGSNMFTSSVPSGLQHAGGSKKLVVEELDSNIDEMLEDEDGHDGTGAAWSNRNPLVEHPEDQDRDNKRSNYSNRNEISSLTNHNKGEGMQLQSQSRSFQRVTYGGINGTYYTATTSRTGSDGATLEESRQADRTTGQATHRISRGIQDKGHSVTRKLDSDGKVDTLQTLHNLDEDELGSFEKAWRGRELQGWNDPFDLPRNSGRVAWEGFSNPFMDRNGTHRQGGSSFQRTFQDQHPNGKPKKVVRINIE